MPPQKHNRRAMFSRSHAAFVRASPGSQVTVTLNFSPSVFESSM